MNHCRLSLALGYRTGNNRFVQYRDLRVAGFCGFPMEAQDQMGLSVMILIFQFRNQSLDRTEIPLCA